MFLAYCPYALLAGFGMINPLPAAASTLNYVHASQLEVAYLEYNSNIWHMVRGVGLRPNMLGSTPL